jgi:hypothetical protein
MAHAMPPPFPDSSAVPCPTAPPRGTPRTSEDHTPRGSSKSLAHRVVTYQDWHFVDNSSDETPVTKKPTSVTLVR